MGQKPRGLKGRVIHYAMFDSDKDMLSPLRQRTGYIPYESRRLTRPMYLAEDDIAWMRFRDLGPAPRHLTALACSHVDAGVGRTLAHEKAEDQ